MLFTLGGEILHLYFNIFKIFIGVLFSGYVVEEYLVGFMTLAF